MTQPRFFDAELCKGVAVGALAATAALALWWPVQQSPQTSKTPPARTALAATAPVAATPAPRALDLGSARLAEPARRLAQWVVDTADNGNRPFVLLDKRAARVLLFEPGGRLLGSTPVLLGYARGDDSVPGIGNRPISAVRASERTTPAGRFVAEPGRNATGEEVIWVDYDAAVSMHRVRLNNHEEQRAQRLATPSAADNRISYGCINLPATFFEQQLWPTVRGRGAVVYVLPEQKPLEQVFPAIARPQQLAPAGPKPLQHQFSRHLTDLAAA